MASTARTDELKRKFDENPRRYFAPLANEFRKAGDIEQAILICEEFLPQQPGHMSGHIVYGQALFEAGRLPESRTVFETALGLDPENLIALRHLGDIARGQGDFASARTWYVRVLDADPRNEEIQGLITSLDAEAGPGIPAAAFVAEVERLGDQGDVATQIIEAVKAPEAPQWLSDVPTTEIPRVVPPPLPMSSPVSTEASNELLDGFSLEGLESHHDTSAAESKPTSARAEGLEPTEFAPPEEAIAEADDLDDSLESGVPSFNAPSQPIASLAGLEGSGASAADLDEVGANDDTFVIPKAAKHPGTALKFIDWMLAPENAKANVNYFGYPQVTTSGIAEYQKLVAELPFLSLTLDQAIHGLREIVPTGSKLQLWDSAWTKVKAG